MYSMAFFVLWVVFFGLPVKRQVELFTWALSAHGHKDSSQKYKTHCYFDVSHCNIINIYNRMNRIPWNNIKGTTSIHLVHSFNKQLGK